MKHLLVTTDFSACSTAAFAMSKKLQQAFEARLTIAAVVDPGETELFRAHHNIESIRKTYFRDLPVQSAIIGRENSISRDITEYAGSNAVDLIIIASHGRAGLKRLAFGSVAEEVLTLAKCPVLVIPYHAKPTRTDHDGMHMIVTTDLSESSEAALPHARRLLEAHTSVPSHLTLLHVAENMLDATFNSPLGVSPEAVREELEADAERRIEDLRAKYLGDTLATTCVIRGTKAPHQEILDYANARDVDIVIVASHGHSLLEETLLGSVAGKFARQAGRPVLVLPRRKSVTQS